MEILYLHQLLLEGHGGKNKWLLRFNKTSALTASLGAKGRRFKSPSRYYYLSFSSFRVSSILLRSFSWCQCIESRLNRMKSRREDCVSMIGTSVKAGAARWRKKRKQRKAGVARSELRKWNDEYNEGRRFRIKIRLIKLSTPITVMKNEVRSYSHEFEKYQ